MVKRTAGQIMEAGRFDAFRLAARGGVLSGGLDVAQRARLADRLAPNAGPAIVAWSIAGGRDGRARPMLTLAIEGSLPVVCQRCLQALEFRLDQRSELLLARDDAELARLDAEEREVVLASSPLDAVAMVEDELLLSLPFAPMHPDRQCPGPAAAGKEGVVASPFAGLAAAGKRSGRITEE